MDARQIAMDLFEVAVKRADPARALQIAWDSAPLATPTGLRRVLAVGKAAVPMMREALRVLGGVDAALVVTNPENDAVIDGARVVLGSHPVPDTSSVAAGQVVADFVSDLGEGDQLVALISGGGSALMELPVAGVSVDDLSALSNVLLSSGLEINDMNLIRQQVSQLKGGGLARMAAPANVVGFLLSDVIGDDLRAIASGPTVSPIGTPDEARALMERSGVWEKVPAAVRDALGSPDVGAVPDADNRLVGSNRFSLEAMRDASPLPCQIVSDHLVGDVGDAADEVLDAARSWMGPGALIFGGETTVRLEGDGLGGRNQELALRVARELGPDWAFLSGGTDGRDGPTDSAGGLVDSGTFGRIAAAGGDGEALLANNDSYAALTLSGDQIMTGGTGTNVADVQVLVRTVD